MSELEFSEVKELEAEILLDCAEMLGITPEEVASDFLKFSAEVDRLMALEGFTEDEALDKVMEKWVLPRP